jgi:hypothetical protein
MATALIADAICSAYGKRKNSSHVNYLCNLTDPVFKLEGQSRNRESKLEGHLGQTCVNAKILGDFAELLISRPEKRGRIDKDRGDQVRVNQADAAAVQPSSFNREPYFIHLRHPDLR